MSDRKETCFEFGPFKVIASERGLLRAGQPVPLTPKEFETLHTLLRAAGRLVTKEQLIKEVWPDTFVGDGSISRNISVLRKALGDGYTDNSEGRLPICWDGKMFNGGIGSVPRRKRRCGQPHRKGSTLRRE
jgi:DNA-binding winged helix-turn-helix (wHTH) protein